MAEAGYSRKYVEVYHKEYFDRPGVRELMKNVTTLAAGLSPEGWRAKLAWIIGLEPGKEIPWPPYIKAMEMYGYNTGEIHKDSSKRPTVPINIHIHKKEEIIDVRGEQVE